MARCVPLTKDRQQAGQYIDQAVEFLDKAEAKASPDLKRISDEDPVFQPLKVHPRFEEIMRKLNKKVPRPRKSCRDCRLGCPAGAQGRVVATVYPVCDSIAVRSV